MSVGASVAVGAWQRRFFGHVRRERWSVAVGATLRLVLQSTGLSVGVSVAVGVYADHEGVQSAGALRQHAELMHAVRQPAQAHLLPEGEGISVAADRLHDCAVQFEIEIAEARTLRVDHGHVRPTEVNRHLGVQARR